MKINNDLKKYIETNIFPSYEKNDEGHKIDHINYVIDRSMKFASTVDNVNYDMVYTIAAYHDIGHYIDAKNHEKISSEMLLKDENLKKYFTDEQIKIMADAVYDHRASLEYEPRSIYGKIVSSADRNVLVNTIIKRTYVYRIKHNSSDSLDQIIEESREHVISKFGKDGYAKDKMYFEDLDYKKYLDELSTLAYDKDLFRKRYFEVNGLNNPLKLNFDEVRRHNPELSLDEVLYKVYELVKSDYNESFDIVRNMILEANNIDEIKYYTKSVNKDLKEYIINNIFSEYSKNDGGHNIAHILEVIRRSFALNDTFKLGLDDNMIFTIASCHDWGKYIDHEKHHLIAANNFYSDDEFKKYFTEEQRKTIKEAIEDHRSSKEEEPRSVYGKLISSADRNTRIEIVFIRSFFVAHERMPEENIEDYLDYTIKRLSKKYDEENPENMFYEDQTYKVFIEDMRNLLKKEDEFKNRYCEVNHISSRSNKVKDEPGEVSYTKTLKRF